MTVPCRIRDVRTDRLDIPLAHPITMAFGTVETLHVVLVRMLSEDGATGIGEASVLGGPYWNQDTAEGVQAVIERYIAPVLAGYQLAAIEGFAAHLATLVRGNAAARHAVETAALDLLSRTLGVSAADLLGGRGNARLPVAWTLSTGSAEADIEEGERALAERGHRRFKLKFGRSSPAEDTARAEAIISAFAGRATVIADVNQGWNEVTAARWLPRLRDIGLEAIEQPMPAREFAGIARLRRGLGLHVIADESVADAATSLELVGARSASVVALKPGRDGGASATRRVAAIAAAAGLDLYGGSMLETSIGTAASALLYSALPPMAFGTELFGPLRLRHDPVARPISVADGMLTVPIGHGLGIELDEDLVGFLAGRARPTARAKPNGGGAGPCETVDAGSDATIGAD